MSEHPSPAYNLPIGDTDTGTEAAEAAAAEVALGFGGVAAAAAVEAAAVEAAGGGATDIASVGVLVSKPLAPCPGLPFIWNPKSQCGFSILRTGIPRRSIAASWSPKSSER
jgi:hypothetical protein